MNSGLLNKMFFQALARAPQAELQSKKGERSYTNNPSTPLLCVGTRKAISWQVRPHLVNLLNCRAATAASSIAAVKASTGHATRSIWCTAGCLVDLHHDW